ncbi:CBS domain-containing protein [Bacillaceae bacterium]
MQTVGQIMTRDVKCCSLNDSLYDAACLMRDYNVGIIPVVGEGNQLLGVVTDRDIVVRGVAEKRNASTPVEEVMSNDLAVANPGMTVDEAANMMAHRQIRRLPVVENGKLVGMVAIGDLAVRNQSAEQAGQALSDISHPTRQTEQPQPLQ